MDLERDVLTEYLRFDAARLRTRRAAPVDLELLVDELGVKLRIEVKATSRAPEATLIPGEANVEIVLFRVMRGGNIARRRERFTLAHEIGHYCALRRFNLRPRSRSEYWKLEQACDDFAGRLLIDDVDLQAVLPQDFLSPRDVMRTIYRLSAECDVSVPVAAHRLGESVDGVSMCSLHFSNPASPERLATVRWCWESNSSPWLRYGRRRHITNNSVLAPLVREVLPAQIGTTLETRVDGVPIAAERQAGGFWMAALPTQRHLPAGHSSSRRLREAATG
jgi:hypothetical protein